MSANPRQQGAFPFAAAAPSEAPDAGQVLFEADRTKKGEGPERLRISVREYQTSKFLDVRIWWRGRGDVWMPSKKGITVRLREIDDVIRVLGEAKLLLGGQP